jgi:hypothetical protein
MPTPTFGELDIGLPGGTLYPDSASALVSCEAAPLQPARSTFAFPGFPATFRVNMGPITRTVTWTVVLRALNLTVLNAIEAAIEALVKSGATGTLTDTQGRTFSNAIIRDWAGQPGFDTIRGGTLNGWVRKEGKLTFEVLTP